MRLPFLAPKKQSGVIIAKHVDGKTEASHEEGDVDPGLMAAAEDLISAMNAKDAKGIALALKSAFECCDAAPHVEGEHLGDE